MFLAFGSASAFSTPELLLNSSMNFLTALMFGSTSSFLGLGAAAFFATFFAAAFFAAVFGLLASRL